MNSSFLLENPLPSLAQWLGDGARAQGFEEWVAHWLSEEESARLTAGDKAALRLLKIFGIAAVEAGRTETEIHGRPYADTTTLLARAAGGAVMGAVISILRQGEDVPLLKIARMLGDDFAAGAKAMAKAAMQEAA